MAIQEVTIRGSRPEVELPTVGAEVLRRLAAMEDCLTDLRKDMRETLDAQSVPMDSETVCEWIATLDAILDDDDE